MDDRLPISALLLARDETSELETLIPSLAFVREVVVVWDPRGNPATRAAAERLGARVFERAFDGFGPQRQFALERCTQDWVLWIDADERLAPGAQQALAAAVAGPPAAWTLARRTRFLGRDIRFCGWQGERVLRLFPRRDTRFDDAPVHERVVVPGTARALDATLVHESYATIEACVQKMTLYAAAGAEKAWRAGKRVRAIDVALRPPLRFLRQYVLQLGFLDGAHGLVLCAFASAQVFLKYAELWQRTRMERASR